MTSVAQCLAEEAARRMGYYQYGRMAFDTSRKHKRGQRLAYIEWEPRVITISEPTWYLRYFVRSDAGTCEPDEAKTLIGGWPFDDPEQHASVALVERMVSGWSTTMKAAYRRQRQWLEEHPEYRIRIGKKISKKVYASQTEL